MNKLVSAISLSSLILTLGTTSVMASPTTVDTAASPATAPAAPPKLVDKVKVSPAEKAAMKRTLQLVFDRMLNGNLNGVKALATGKFADDLVFADSVQFKKANLQQKRKYGRIIVTGIQTLAKVPNGYTTRDVISPVKMQGSGYYRTTLVKVQGAWKVAALTSEDPAAKKKSAPSKHKDNPSKPINTYDPNKN